MKENHLSDLLIQQSVYEPLTMDPAARHHLDHCAHCLERATAYDEQFSLLKDMPRPSFDFDLSTEVLSRIEWKRKRNLKPLYLICLVGFSAGVSGFSFWIFRAYLYRLYTGFSYLMVYLSLAAMISLFCFQMADNWRTYREKIRLIKLI